MSFVSLIGASSFAATFSCKLEADKSVTVVGAISQDKAAIQINDENNALDIRDLRANESIEMYRSLRKNEAKYSFAKYYVDFNAWQDIEISIPKNVSGRYFKAFLTVYGESGPVMVPGYANKLSCVLL
jgi:hypothetical protein